MAARRRFMPAVAFRADTAAEAASAARDASLNLLAMFCMFRVIILFAAALNPRAAALYPVFILERFWDTFVPASAWR